MTMVNYFDSPRAAALYARGRPFYHEGVLKEVAAQLGWTAPLSCALDVGCGTGLSTCALLPYADEIIGIDASPAMLAEAFTDPRITYHCSPAERLPIADGRADLLSLCEAFHWLDQSVFLAEAHRVLKPDGVLLVYGGGIRGVMQEEATFQEWFYKTHLPRYPEPPRQPKFAIDNGAPEGFELVATGKHEMGVPMTAHRFADFLLSVSNTLQYLEQTGQTPEEHHDFLVRELLPFYSGDPDTVRHIRYGGLYFLMRKP